MDRDNLMGQLLEDWFEAHPAERVRRHHALVDANVLRMVWCVTTGIDRPAWAEPTLQRMGR